MRLPQAGFYAGPGCTTIAKCHILLALWKLLKIIVLAKVEPWEVLPQNDREILDMTGLSAILALGYEEC